MLGKLVDFLIKRTTLSRVDSKTSDETKEPTNLFLLAFLKREIEGAKKLLCCDVDSNYTPPCKLFFSLVANPIKIFTSKPKMALS